MPLFVETIMPIRTFVAVHLVVVFIVDALEEMRIRLTIFCSKPWS